MATENDIKQRNVDVAEELWRNFKAEASRRGLSMRVAFAEALSRWVDSPQGNPLLTVARVTPVSVYTVETDQRSRVAALMVKAEQVLASPHPVAGMALAANIESFFLLIGKEANAISGNDPTSKRTLEEILESERRIRDFIEQKRREPKGPRGTLPGESD